MRRIRNTHQAIKTKQRRLAEFWREMNFEKTLQHQKKFIASFEKK